LTPNPIRKVLSTLSTSGVRHLLMGGQACVLYGAAEFSRDTDVVIADDTENLTALQDALDRLHAERIAVPPFEAEFLRRGHAVHFRCQRDDLDRMRLDVMSHLRGVAEFETLWQRRTTLTWDENQPVQVLSLPDLVQAKKTQRDKDWPMLRRLVEAHYVVHQDQPTPARLSFWLTQSRTPQMLLDLAREYPEDAASAGKSRPLLSFAIRGDADELEQAIAEEEAAERRADRDYWQPLKEEIAELREQRRQGS